jgi:hypothetical protein
VSIIQFRAPSAIRIERERNEDACWIVLTPRGHGWLHATLGEAVAEAKTLAAGYGIGILPRTFATTK